MSFFLFFNIDIFLCVKCDVCKVFSSFCLYDNRKLYNILKNRSTSQLTHSFISNYLGKTRIKRSFFFSVRSTKGIGRVNPPDHFFFIKSGLFSPKIGKKRKKWHGPLSHWCREGKTLVVRPLKKKKNLCVSSSYFSN